MTAVVCTGHCHHAQRRFSLLASRQSASNLARHLRLERVRAADAQAVGGAVDKAMEDIGRSGDGDIEGELRGRPAALGQALLLHWWLDAELGHHRVSEMRHGSSRPS